MEQRTENDKIYHKLVLELTKLSRGMNTISGYFFPIHYLPSRASASTCKKTRAGELMF
jgi:hypothetical protein